MELNYKAMMKAMSSIVEERNIPADIIVDALKEAMVKAYKKYVDINDIEVVAELNEKRKTIDLYQLFTVVDKIEDYETQMLPDEAREYDPNAKVGDVVRVPAEVNAEMSRGAAAIAKSVLRQRLREAEKAVVYDKYIDLKGELRLGVVDSVRDKTILVRLDESNTAAMLKNATIPGEILKEGDPVKVVITDVRKEGKGPQILVSRSDELLIKRLFEKGVSEIYDGKVIIKAIARDAGERTKMAVISTDPNIDPVGACIGQRGSRVQQIIDDLHGEKIDIFQWSDDITELVKNALAPAEVRLVVPREDGSLLVVVDKNQLSLAIGKKGKNARLAVKLVNNRKIDIKSFEDLEEEGLDYSELVREAEERKAEMKRERARRESEQLEQDAKAEDRRAAAAEKLAQQKAIRDEIEQNEDIIPEEMAEYVQENLQTEMAMEPEEAEEKPQETAVEEPVSEPETVEEPQITEEEPEEEPEVVEEEPEEEAEPEEKETRRKHADLEDMAAKNTYVSVFEKLADTSKPKQDSKPKKRKKKGEEDEYKVRNKDLEKQIKKDLQTVDVRPVYTEEELEEIEARRLEEEEREYDIDYDEYEDYYDDYDEDDN